MPFDPPGTLLARKCALPLPIQDPKWLHKCQKIFQFCLQTLMALTKHKPEVSLRLYLQGGLAADRVRNETITYEFLAQVLSLSLSLFLSLSLMLYVMWE